MCTVVKAAFFLVAFSLFTFASPVNFGNSPINSEYPAGHGRRLLGSSFGPPGPATYDYIVVGGGTAGLVVATRLAEDASKSVAVIEAGTFYEISNSNLSQIPLFGPGGAGKSPFDTFPFVDWQFQTTPQAVSSPPGIQQPLR